MLLKGVAVLAWNRLKWPFYGFTHRLVLNFVCRVNNEPLLSFQHKSVVSAFPSNIQYTQYSCSLVFSPLLMISLGAIAIVVVTSSIFLFTNDHLFSLLCIPLSPVIPCLKNREIGSSLSIIEKKKNRILISLPLTYYQLPATSTSG